MSDSSQSAEFELVLEGPADSTTQSLQKLKGVLIADLNLTVDEVKTILQSFPHTVRRADEEGKLTPAYEALRRAGAKVLIVRPAASDTTASLPDGAAPAEDLSNILNDALKSIDMSMVEEEYSAANVVSTESDPGILDVGSELLLDTGEEKNAEPVAAPTPAAAKKPPTAPTPAPAQTPKPDDAPLFEYDLASSEPEEAPPAKAEPRKNIAKTAEPTAAKSPLFHMVEKADALQPEPPKPPEPAKEKKAVSAAVPAPKEEFSLSLEEKPAAEEPASDLEIQVPPPAPTTAQKAAQVECEETPVVTEKKVKINKATPREALKEEASQDAPGEKAQASEQGEEDGPTESDALEIEMPAKKKSRIPLDIVIPVAVLGTLLGYANIQFFSGETPQITEKEIQSVLAGEGEKSADKPKKKKESAPAPTVAPKIVTTPAVGEAEDELMKVSWDFDVAAPKIISGSFTVSTSPPSELTSTEIAQHKSLPPWITKAEAAYLNFKESEPGVFSAEGKAKTYIEHEGQRTRTTASYNAVAKADEGALQFTVTVSLFAGFAEPQAENTRYGEKLDDGTFKFSLTKELTVPFPPSIAAEPQAPKETSENP